MPFDDDAEADNPGFRPPPHPDDRIWRHPSEMRAHPIVPFGASTPPLVTAPSSVRRGRGRRLWVACAAVGAVGALAGAGVVLAVGVGGPSDGPPVTAGVADDADAPLGGPAALVDVSAQVGPATVGVTAADGTGGSGLVVRDDGIVVTSAALVAGTAAPVVLRADGSTVAAEVVGADPATGLAVLDLAGEGHSAAVLPDEGSPVPGATAFVFRGQRQSADGDDGGGTAVGFAVDDTGGAADGDGTDHDDDEGERASSVAAPGTVGQAVRFVGPGDAALDGVSISGDATPAALGGPVVDGRGAVVGIVTAVDEGGAWYAAPVDVARKVVDDLLTDGVVHHVRLGIEGTDAGGADSGGTDDTADGSDTAGAAPLAAGTGALVASVVAGSPAEAGGLAAGDVIVAVDDAPVASLADLLVQLRARSPGDAIDVTVARADGSRATLAITLDETPASAR